MTNFWSLQGTEDEIFYVPFEFTLKIESLLSFLRYLLLMSTFLPISMFINFDVVKVWESLFLGWDVSMYSKERAKMAFVSNTSLMEELGQVNYIFSDKTGTLTRNEMLMKSVSIGTYTYGDLKASSVEEIGGKT